jgi:hypothetical protein
VSSSSVIGVTCVVGAKGIVKGDLGVLGGVCDREQVFVKAKYFCSTHPPKKLLEKNLGPFEIIALPGSHSITV